MKNLVLLLVVVLGLSLGACSTKDEIRVENICDRPVTVDVIEIPEGLTAENSFVQSAVVLPGTTAVVAGLVNFGGEDRGILEVLETGWSFNFNDSIFEAQDGLVVLPPAACPV